MDRTILIASSSVDRATWKPVAENLTRRGYDVFTYEADKVALGEIPLEIEVTDAAGLQVSYADKRVNLSGVAAAWFRRSTFFANASRDGTNQLGVDVERKILQAALWETVPVDVWLNSPDRIQRAERKLCQLALAQELGMKVPHTIATNQWQPIQEKLPSAVIYKSSYSLLYDGINFKSLYTTPFEDTSSLPTDHNPFPGLWQPFISKAREWRITVVGDETFDAAIYTTEDAKDDWRRHQLLPAMVDFRKEDFPEDMKEKCLAYLGKLGLQFGAFDFIEDQNGELTFLECNPNGQFMWLEATLDLPISAAISDELAKVARHEN